MTDADLPAFPRLLHGLDVVYGPDDCVQLRGATPPIRLAGKLARTLLPLLDGNCPLPDILAKLNDWPASEIFRALELLSVRGLIDSGPPPGPDPVRDQAVFYWSATTGPAHRGEGVLQDLAKARIHLFGWGALAEAVADTLRTCGSKGLAAEFWAPPPGVFAVTPVASTFPFPEPSELEQRIPGCSGAELALLVLPRPAPTLTSAVNAACVRLGIPFLPVVINGVEATVGPTVTGRRSACYECFRLRLLSNSPFPADDIAYASALDLPPARVTLAEWHPFTTTVGSWAAMEAIRLVTRFASPVTLGRVWYLHALTGQCEAARIWKIPRCPACSGALGATEGGNRRVEHSQPDQDR